VRSSVVEASSPSADQTGPATMSTEEHADRPVLDARDAFTQLGTLSFENTSMEVMLQRIAELAKHVIPGVAEASVSLIANDKATTAAYTGRLAVLTGDVGRGRVTTGSD
jgi:hypothetical protein